VEVEMEMSKTFIKMPGLLWSLFLHSAVAGQSLSLTEGSADVARQFFALSVLSLSGVANMERLDVA
jgi:hypothetical protein